MPKKTSRLAQSGCERFQSELRMVLLPVNGVRPCLVISHERSEISTP